MSANVRIACVNTAPMRLRVYILKNIFLDKQSYKNIFSKYFCSKKLLKLAFYGNAKLGNPEKTFSDLP